jgi:tRNA (cytidine32/uridine32-2'-O)-methyltransferase
MAVQVIAYEVRMAWLATQEKEVEPKEETAYPLVDDLERFYGHLEQTLLSTGLSVKATRAGDEQAAPLFTRARPESQELNILRGILASIEQKNKESSLFGISSPRGRGAG